MAPLYKVTVPGGYAVGPSGQNVPGQGQAGSTGNQMAGVSTGTITFDGANANATPMMTADQIKMAIQLGQSPYNILFGSGSTEVQNIQNMMNQAGQPNINQRYGPVTIQGKPINKGDLYISTDNLPDDVRPHAKDSKWMADHGYVAINRSDGEGEQQHTAMRWVKKEVADEHKDMLQKQGWMYDNPLPAMNNVVTQDEAQDRPNVNHMVTAHPTEMFKAAQTLPKDEFIKLQHKLWDGGYYQGKSQPMWGTFDPATQEAYTEAMKDSLAHPDLTLDESIAAADKNVMAHRAADRRSRMEEAKATAADSSVVGVMSEDSVRKMGDDLAHTILGRKLSDEEAAKLTAAVQSRQGAEGQAKHDAAYQAALAQAGMIDPGELDRFVAAVSSQGQLDAAHWPDLLKAVGMDPSTPLNALTQQQLLREYAADYYDQFHNWSDVSTAMLSGPLHTVTALGPVGRANQRLDQKSFKDTISDRAAVATRQFLGTDQTNVAAGAVGGFGSMSGGQVTTTQTFNPSDYAEEQLKRDNPGEYLGHEFLNRYEDFKAMLGPAIPGAGQTL